MEVAASPHHDPISFWVETVSLMAIHPINEAEVVLEWKRQMDVAVPVDGWIAPSQVQSQLEMAQTEEEEVVVVVGLLFRLACLVAFPPRLVVS